MSWLHVDMSIHLQLTLIRKKFLGSGWSQVVLKDEGYHRGFPHSMFLVVERWTEKYKTGEVQAAEKREWEWEIYPKRRIEPADKGLCAGGDILFLVTKKQLRGVFWIVEYLKLMCEKYNGSNLEAQARLSVSAGASFSRGREGSWSLKATQGQGSQRAVCWVWVLCWAPSLQQKEIRGNETGEGKD